MTLDEAKKQLNSCERDELRDHAFGDREISWFRKDASGQRHEVAGGYQGNSGTDVSFLGTGPNAGFTGDDARSLLSCGTLTASERNDTTGDDNVFWRP